MKYRELSQTGIKVSEISLGCWTLGGLNVVEGFSAGWADVDEREAIRGIHYAIDHGVNHFDSADIYGNGASERLLAKAFGKKHKDIIIATKIGYFRGTALHSYDPIHIRHQCEQSLKNLGRDVIDIYYLHNAKFGKNDRYLDGAIEVVYRLKEEGKIRVIGQSDWSADAIARVIPKVKPEVVQCWASALDDHFIREGSPLRKMMEEGRLSYVAFSPLAQALLLGKYSAKNPPTFEVGDNRRNSPKFQKEFLTELEPKIEKIKARFGSSICDLSRMAIQYLLHNKLVACVIPGFRNEQQVADHLKRQNPLTEDDIAFIQQTLQ